MYPRTLEVTIPENAYAWLKVTAQAQGVSVEALAAQLIRTGIKAQGLIQEEK